MSAFSLDTEKPSNAGRAPQVRRLIYGPAMVVALALAASGTLAIALLLATMLEY